MIKTKTFQFLVSHAAGNNLHRDSSIDFWTTQSGKYKIDDEKSIDKKINAWIEKEQADVIDIKTMNYTLDRHNNGRQDTVVLVYTILYREAKKEA